MKFRLHRGTLEESMQTVCEVNSKAELVEVLAKDLAFFPISITEQMISIIPYAYDGRIEWDTYIVSLEYFGIAGFTNGPLPI
jgi:hypothetical protein